MKLDKINRKYILFLAVLVLVTPIGIILPYLFSAGSAWGEWSIEELNKIIGYIPSGLKQTANLWHPLFPDYNFMFNKSGNILLDSLFYMISGVIGSSLCFISSFVFLKGIINEK